MKICHVTDYLPRYHNIWGGAELAAVNLIDLLQEKGHAQTVLSTKPDNASYRKYNLYPISVLNDYFGKYAELLKLWTFDLLSFISVSKALEDIKPDILHLHNFRVLSFSVVSAAKRLKIPVVFSIYDNWCLCPNHTLITKTGGFCKKYHSLSCFSCTHSHKKIGTFFRRFLFNIFLKKIDIFIVLSNTMAEVLRDYGIPKEKVVFLPLPLSKDTWENEKKQDGEIEPDSVLFCGWVSPHKGLKILVDQMLKVIKEIPGAKLYVIETGVVKKYKDSILDFISKNDLEKYVYFLGKKNNDEVQKYLRRSELVVVPEQWGIAWPIFLTEAMFAKKPIIASRIGDIPFFIKDGINGYTVKANNAEEFGEKIIYCLRNKNLISSFGEQSRKRIAEICDNKNIHDGLINIYKKAI